MTELELYQITSRTFCAGAFVHQGRIVKAAPILRRYVRWTLAELARQYPDWKIEPAEPVLLPVALSESEDRDSD
jgi:hypothetical protein